VRLLRNPAPSDGVVGEVQEARVTYEDLAAAGYEAAFEVR